MAEKPQDQTTAGTLEVSFEPTGGVVANAAKKDDREATPDFSFAGGSVRIRASISGRVFGVTGGRYDFLTNPRSGAILLYAQPGDGQLGQAVRNACGAGQDKTTPNAERTWHSFPIDGPLARSKPGLNPLYQVPKGSDLVKLDGAVIPAASVKTASGEPVFPDRTGLVIRLVALDPKHRHPLAGQPLAPATKTATK